MIFIQYRGSRLSKRKKNNMQCVPQKGFYQLLCHCIHYSKYTNSGYFYYNNFLLHIPVIKCQSVSLLHKCKLSHLLHVVAQIISATLIILVSFAETTTSILYKYHNCIIIIMFCSREWN